ncbi:MAG: hypothetical protein JW745_04740 [Sedimentisphaerales bacterium]|nr:hypothetical protein [Sedimentisphaerales bacterium]MBN2842767.1 hypothetical protein [Sedimentisphaerales bacterium]
MGTTTRNDNRIPSDWLELVGELYDLRPIRDDKSHEKAIDALRKIMRLTRPNAAQRDYKATLADIIQKYENEAWPLPKLEGDGIDNLAYLASENGLSGSDIGRILGDRTLGSKILNRQRALSKMHIKKLCEFFKVKPELFIA